jgi:hypothetical protein
MPQLKESAVVRPVEVPHECGVAAQFIEAAKVILATKPGTVPRARHSRPAVAAEPHRYLDLRSS